MGTFGLPVLFNPTKDHNHGEKGRRYYQYRRFEYVFKRAAPKDLIVMYDIPSDKRKERDWFRRHLQKFGYIMVQKSVWIGPSPLPKDFLDYVKSIGLSKQLKTFKLATPYIKKRR